MPSRAPLDAHNIISGDVESWKRLFVKSLQWEFTRAASQLMSEDLSSRDSQTAWRQAMLATVVDVLLESGGTTAELTRLLDENARRLSPRVETLEWTAEKNARRLKLIDKWIQHSLSADESVELERLTQQLRKHCDTEDLLPIEGAKELHRLLLGMIESE